MAISLIGSPPGIIGSIGNRRLFHFFLFGGGGGGAGNGGVRGGHSRSLRFSAFLEKEDIVYMYKGTGGAAGGTSTNAIGGGGGAASFIYVDPRGTRLGSDPNGYSVNTNVLLAVCGGGGGGGTETGANGGRAGGVDTNGNSSNDGADADGGGTNPGTGATGTAPGSGGTLDLGGGLIFNASDGANAKLGSTAFGGNGGAGYVNGTANGGGTNTGADEATVVGDDRNGHGAAGYQDGGAGGGGGFYGGGGSTYDAGASKVGGGGGGSSYARNAKTFFGGFNITHAAANYSFDYTDVAGYNLDALSSIHTTAGQGGALGGSGVAGGAGQDGYIVILDENGDLAAETTGSASGWSYTVT
tara:strand:- start:7055 stop:8122 length:1068 start_codon:yes stop_codon:yes gene_type:complete